MEKTAASENSPPTRTYGELLRDSSFRTELIWTLVFFGGIMYLYVLFMPAMDKRPGAILSDPLHALVKPGDFSMATFGVMYCAIIFCMFQLRRRPSLVLLGIRAFTLTTIFRMGAIYLLPLQPPATGVPLNDFLIKTLYGENVFIYNDLFFSGHVSTMFILFLVSEKLWVRGLMLLSCFVVGGLLVFQQVHYSIDAAAAPFFAYGSYRLLLILEEYFPPLTQGRRRTA